MVKGDYVVGEAKRKREGGNDIASSNPPTVEPTTNTTEARPAKPRKLVKVMPTQRTIKEMLEYGRKKKEEKMKAEEDGKQKKEEETEECIQSFKKMRLWEGAEADRSRVCGSGGAKPGPCHEAKSPGSAAPYTPSRKRKNVCNPSRG